MTKYSDDDNDPYEDLVDLDVTVKYSHGRVHYQRETEHDEFQEPDNYINYYELIENIYTRLEEYCDMQCLPLLDESPVSALPEFINLIIDTTRINLN